MRLDKFLCDCGLGTRSEVKNLIKKSKVLVNNSVSKDPGLHVSEVDEVIVNGERISYSKYTYIILNKPGGVVTAREDKNDKTVMDLVDYNARNLSPVGRLDKDTEGILLITNDGNLNHNMLSPNKHVDKTYYVEADKVISDSDMDCLCKGVDIKDDNFTLPAKVERISDHSIYLTIHEGRFHQVKRMLEAVNNKVTYLKRVSFGPLELPMDLNKGEYRLLNEEELKLIERYKGKDE